MTCKDTNIPSTYSGHRSISNSNNYEMINYGSHKQDSTADSNLKKISNYTGSQISHISGDKLKPNIIYSNV